MVNNSSNNNQCKYDPIDVVYTWVDGSDPKWLEKKDEVLKEYKIPLTNNGIVKGRFENHDELLYSLRSLDLYLPWARKIFIVTDNQTPDWLSTANPKIEIIDHTDIFPEFVKTPVFNSTLIEFFLHRIPDLSEKFIYFNDDFMINKPLNREDFFSVDGRCIRYITKPFVFDNKIDLSVTKEQLTDKQIVQRISDFFQSRELDLHSHQNSIYLFKMQYPAFNEFFWLKHVPYALKKSHLRKTYRAYKSFVELMSSNQFRAKTDLWGIGLITFDERINNSAVFSDKENDLFEYALGSDAYGQRIEDVFELWNPVYKFISIADGETSKDNFIKMAKQALSVRFNKKSQFEKNEEATRDKQSLSQFCELTQSTVIQQKDQINCLNQAIIERDGQIACLNQAVVRREEQIDNLNKVVIERDEDITSLRRMVAQLEEQIINLNRTIVELERQVQSFVDSNSWKLTRPIRITSKMVRSIIDEDERYRWLKTAYWRLPEFLRRQLSRQRYAYVAKYLKHDTSHFMNQNHSSVNALSIGQNSWLAKVNQAEQIVIITCSFEFDELVNQRPINAAKYFSSMGYFVLFIAWQWSSQDVLTKGCSEVWPNVYQVPLFDFIAQAEEICFHNKFSLFLATLPAPVLINLVPCLRQRGFAIVYDIMDEWEAFYHAGQAPWFSKSAEESLVLQADYVCVVSSALQDKFSSFRSDISVIGNGYAPEVLGLERKAIADSHQNSEHVVGYFGHLTDAWFDWRLIFHLAKHRTDVRFEIIGYGEPDWVRRESAAFPNIRLLGKISPQDLHYYTAGWTVGLIPFIEGDLADAVDPIKIYEYLYFGLPTIVTGISHLKDYPMTYFAERKNILPILDHVLHCKHIPEQLDSFLQQTTWSARFDTLVRELNNKQGMWCLYAH